MELKRKAKQLLSELEKIFPEAKTELENWSTPFQFLVCIILSAQSTDKQVNKLTKVLFSKYPDAFSFASANLWEIEEGVKSVNYFRSKARHIKEMSIILSERYSGEPPRVLKELIGLPGVGYKTANVFLNDMFKSNQGIAVDTHVSRVARYYGLTKNLNPTKISHDLELLYPQDVWYKVNATFVLYGRYILRAKKPVLERIVNI